jgi:AraC family transcriptional activator of pobA
MINFATKDICLMNQQKDITIMSFEDLRHLLEQIDSNPATRFLCDDYSVETHGNAIFRSMLQPHKPYRMVNPRMGIILQGTADVTINLIEHHFEAGSFVFMGSGTLVEINRVAPEVDMCGIMLKDHFLNELFPNLQPEPFDRQEGSFFLQLDKRQLDWVRRIFLAIVDTSHLPDGRRIAKGIIVSLLTFFSSVYGRQNVKSRQAGDRSRELFGSFLHLVHDHCRSEHTLGYYADKLCVTQRYLGTVVKNVSSVTAKEWIDRALITEAKVMLLHTSNTVAMVSDAMHFPTSSFFCKYFKRNTGMTPLEYRAQEAR